MESSDFLMSMLLYGLGVTLLLGAGLIALVILVRQIVKNWTRLRDGTLGLIGRQRWRQKVRALVQDGSPPAMAALAEAVAHSRDDQTCHIALDALRRFATQGHAEAQEALCDLVIEHDHPLAREIVLAAQYLPRDEHRRALFYFLMEQWEAYEGLDFDQSLLRTAYEMADVHLQRRIVEKVRRAGRVDWIGVIAVGRRGRRLDEMSNQEWQAALTVLEKEKQWEAVWRLAQVAPVRWSAKLLGRLKEARWAPGKESEEPRPQTGASSKEKARRECSSHRGSSPPTPTCHSSLATDCGIPAFSRERAGFEELMRLAERCLGGVPTLGPLMGCRATLRGHTDSVERVAIGPRGGVVMSANTSETRGEIYLWRLPEGTELATLKGHMGGTFFLDVSSDKQLIASLDENQTVRLWRFPECPPEASPSEAQASLLQAYEEGTTILEGMDALTICLAISPDRRLLASGLFNNVRVRRLPDGAGLKWLSTHTPFVQSLAISPDGQVLVGGGHKTVQLWRLPDGAELATLKKHTGLIYCLAISPDGRLLASGSGDRTIRLWRLPDGAELATLKGHTKRVRCLTISPDGHLLASGSEDHTVRLWRLPDGAKLATLKGHTKTVSSLDISPDSRMLVSGSHDKTLRLWRLTFLRLSILPVTRMSLEDMAWAQEALEDRETSDAERDWLRFILALMRWRRRFDVEVSDAPSHIPAGEFDIEIEG